MIFKSLIVTIMFNIFLVFNILGWEIASIESPENTIITDIDNSVTVAFNSQSTPPITFSTDLLVGSVELEGYFNGDLLSQRYSGIRFKINGTGINPTKVKVCIRRILSETPFQYRTWCYSKISVSTNIGEWTIVEIPLLRNVGWVTPGEYKYSENMLNSMWQEDLSNVDALYVCIQSDGMLAQAYSISDFQLLDADIISLATNLSPIQAYFGINSFMDLTDEELNMLMVEDSDGDEMNDYYELLAGFNPNNSESIFNTRIAMIYGSNIISWQGILGKSYAVLYSNNLTTEFTLIADSTQQCIATGLMFFEHIILNHETSHFYKVINY